jgi:hypothetical protein
MSDISIKIDGDLGPIKKDLRELSKILKRIERMQQQSNRRRVRNVSETERTITNIESRQMQRREAMERRLSRRRARNRLRGIRERVRQERRAQREIERIRQRSIDRQRQFLGTIGGSVGGTLLGVGTAALFEARQGLEFSRQIALIATTAKVSRAEQEKLKESVTSLSVEYGLAREEIARGIGTIVEESGDFDLATTIIEKMTKASVALGAEMSDLGKVALGLKVDMGLTNKEVADFLDVIAAQGDVGRITLAKFAAESQAFFNIALRAGVRSKRGIIGIGALLQAGVQKSPAETITALDAFYRDLGKKSKKISEGLGIELYQPGTERFRFADELVKDIVKASGGSVSKLRDLGFEAESIKLIGKLAAQYNNAADGADRFASINTVLNAGLNAGANIQDKYNRINEESATSFDKLGRAFTALSESGFGDMIDRFADAMVRFTSRENMDRLKGVIDTIKKMYKFTPIGALAEYNLSALEFLGGGKKRDGASQAQRKVKELASPPFMPRERFESVSAAPNITLNTDVHIDRHGNVRSQSVEMNMSDRGKRTVKPGMQR